MDKRRIWPENNRHHLLSINHTGMKYRIARNFQGPLAKHPLSTLVARELKIHSYANYSVAKIFLISLVVEYNDRTMHSCY